MLPIFLLQCSETLCLCVSSSFLPLYDFPSLCVNWYTFARNEQMSREVWKKQQKNTHTHQHPSCWRKQRAQRIWLVLVLLLLLLLVSMIIVCVSIDFKNEISVCFFSACDSAIFGWKAKKNEVERMNNNREKEEEKKQQR